MNFQDGDKVVYHDGSGYLRGNGVWKTFTKERRPFQEGCVWQDDFIKETLLRYKHVKYIKAKKDLWVYHKNRDKYFIKTEKTGWNEHDSVGVLVEEHVSPDIVLNAFIDGACMVETPEFCKTRTIEEISSTRGFGTKIRHKDDDEEYIIVAQSFDGQILLYECSTKTIRILKDSKDYVVIGSHVGKLDLVW